MSSSDEIWTLHDNKRMDLKVKRRLEAHSGWCISSKWSSLVWFSERCPAARLPAAVKRPLMLHSGWTSGTRNQNKPLLRGRVSVSPCMQSRN
ncbi:Hypothetical predicted protein [Xyrichtys novacula]|uniref:Uncharacterized protein n=1 Tax=Xyrichtys novacula TaxID=13765 RepID=A0AAV1HAT8_XYRNO|nr:Hypothetical predicted protein [Xyrichtys novacula]